MKLSRRQLLAAGVTLAIAAGCGTEDNPTPVTFAPSPSPSPLPSPTPNLISPRFPQPPVRQSVGGTLDTTLTVRNAVNRAGGQTVSTRTYDGLLGGPTLRVKPGDTLRFNLVNQLPPNPDQDVVYPDMNTPHHSNSINNHTHGLHVSPQANSDNIFVDVAPGESFQYEYHIPADHPDGTYWYHPHKHGAATVQIFSGMGAALLLEGPLDRVPEVAAARDNVFLINELNIDPKTGTVPEHVPNVPPNGTYPLSQRILLVNGLDTPTLYAQPGEVVRLRVINATVRGMFPFSIDGHDLLTLALDGNTLPQLRRDVSLELASGNRADLLIRAGSEGSYAIRKGASTSVAGAAGGGGPDPEVILATLVVAGPPVTMGLPDRLPVPASLGGDIRSEELTGRRTLTFAQPGGPTQNLGPPAPPGLATPTRNYSAFTIDDQRFDPRRVDQSVRLNAVEEWTLVNTSQSAHPFHIHVNPFQVVSINGVPLAQPEWRDTIEIPSGGRVVIRSRFLDFRGLYVLHCHILVHEDLGMMQTVEVF